ncbi:hepatic lectin-like [Mytilus edulis]|uniref:hepatic lectin-like n=1 Tax=Mytilus edulis TaxID=6550 RepID=UPI0039F1148C
MNSNNKHNLKCVILNDRLSSKSEYECERQWKRYNGHCYYFSTYGTQWKYAKVRCEEFHAKLVKIDNKEEERWLQNRVDNSNRIQRNKVNGFWIDMKAKIGKFYWTQDNTKPDFLSFEKGYPQSYDTDSLCVFLTQHKKWHNGVCSNSVQFICESDLCY